MSKKSVLSSKKGFTTVDCVEMSFSLSQRFVPDFSNIFKTLKLFEGTRHSHLETTTRETTQDDHQ